MASLPFTLGFNTALISATYLADHLLLLPIKVGDDEGCESLQKKVDSLKVKMNVDIPIKVVEHPMIPWAAHGCAFFGRGGVTVPSSEIKNLTKESDDTQTAILAHEIAHLKHNDCARDLAVVLVVFVVSTVFLWYVLPVVLLPYVDWIAMIPTVTTIFIHHVRFEKAADLEACKYTTNAQKQAMVDWFEKHRQKNLDWRNDGSVTGIWKSLRRLRVDSEGNSLLGRLTHPSPTERIRYIKKQIKPERSQRAA